MENNSINNGLKLLRGLFVGIAFFGVGISLLSDTVWNASAVGKSSAPQFAARSTVDLTKSGNSITLDEFLGKTEVLGRLNGFARLDDVDLVTDCSKMTGMGDFFVGGFDVSSPNATEAQKAAMLYNTWFLQQLIYCGSVRNGSAGTTIKLPEGTLYFMSGHLNMASGSSRVERHVIKLHDYVSLTGVGSEINSKKTVLKPYSEESEFRDINGKAIEGGLDMFFFNNISAYGSAEGVNSHGANLYLSGNHFSDFVIDSAETSGIEYNTSGKGFMVNLFRDSTWYNVTVQNTDGTGFGVDCPLGDSWIDSSRAYGNGKGIRGALWRGGGSGFGIGTGYSNEDSFEIRNSEAKGNGIFGFFYEHQNRFNIDLYQATAATGGFRIKNSTAEANTWNFGGLRANDVTVSGVTSITGSHKQSNGYEVHTIRHFNFSDDSRSISIGDVKISGTAYSDIDSKKWYADAILWAEKNSIANDSIKINARGGTDGERAELSRNDNFATSESFGIGEPASRADIVAMMWHMGGYPGKVLSVANGNLTRLSGDYATSGHVPYLPTCFDDVNPERSFAASVGWAADSGITNGVGGTCVKGSTGGAQFFYADGSGFSTTVTRAEAATMLYRLAGSPPVSAVEDFKDVTDRSSWYYNAVQWAVQNKITNGIGDNTFAPEATCTREQIVAFLYRYWARFICEKDCPDSDVLLDIHHNE